LLGALAVLVVPPEIIGLIGSLPIAIGIKKLIDLRQPDESEEIQSLQSRSSLRFLAVAGVTFANGGDNIGVYTPVFATRTPAEIITLVVVFMVMVAAWCAAGYFLVNHSFAGVYIRRAGRVLLPFVLIALGVFIMLEAFDIGLR
jgi:cadmium resistance protein CadD (predicted permease)